MRNRCIVAYDADRRPKSAPLRPLRPFASNFRAPLAPRFPHIRRFSQKT